MMGEVSTGAAAMGFWIPGPGLEVVAGIMALTRSAWGWSLSPHCRWLIAP